MKISTGKMRERESWEVLGLASESFVTIPSEKQVVKTMTIVLWSISCTTIYGR